MTNIKSTSIQLDVVEAGEASKVEVRGWKE